MNTVFAKRFGLSAITALLMFAAADAGATTISYSALACSGPHTVSDGHAANFTGAWITEYCPVVVESGRGFQSSSINVYGWSNGLHNIQVHPCRVSITGSAQNCDSPFFSSNSSGGAAVDIHVEPTFSSWGPGGANDGYYLLITMANNTALFSYTISL